MAAGKKAFVLYTDIIHTVEKLPDKEAGELFKIILRYVNDLDPKVPSGFVDIAFEPIKQQLKRDLQKYHNICDRNKENGSKGGRPKNPKNPVGLSGNPKEPKKADSDTDTDTDTDTDKDIIKTKGFSPPAIEKVKSLFVEKGSTPIEAESFWNFYESKGWMVGKTKMKNWKAACANWIARNNKVTVRKTMPIFTPDA